MPTRPPPEPDETPDALLAEYVARVESGESVDIDELCRAHPQHATVLRSLHAQVERLKKTLKAPAAAGEPATKAQPRDPEPSASPGSFAARLEKKYGEGVDPEVSLDEGPGASAAASSPSSAPTDELVMRLAQHGLKESRYKLEGELARGGMGAILRVWDEDLRRHLAMKVILGKAESPSAGGTPPIDSRQLARFLEEAQVTGQLEHPGIVPVHELGLDNDGRVYFTMKLVKGRDLKKIFDLVFEEKEGWNETRALGLILRACEAMGYAHAKGVIHRDLKPANVMVGNYGEVYVMDWGLARVLGRKDTHDIRLKPEFSTSLRSVATERRGEREETPDSPLITMDGDVMGTPAYMSPEQARGEIEKLSARSDVYSLGAMLYHLLARQMPYVPPGERITNRTLLSRLLDGPPKPIHSIKKDVPAELVAICEKAMPRDATKRYPDTLALAEDLRAFLEHRVVRAYETGAVAELKKWVARNKPLAAAIAGAAAILVGGVATSTTFATRAKEKADEAETARKETASKNSALVIANKIAVTNENLATQMADDVLSLSAIQDLDVLVDRVDKLWPACPENIPKYEDWLSDARTLIDGRRADPAHEIKARHGLARHRVRLAELEQRALPQTEEEKAAERASHPRKQELAQMRSWVEWMARMLGKSPWPSESDVRAELDCLSPPPADASVWNNMAMSLLRSDAGLCGDEVKAFVCAQRAVAEANDKNRYDCLGTLATALFRLGRFDEALARGKESLEAAPASERKKYEDDFEGLETEVKSWQDPSRAIREKEWSAHEAEVEELDKAVSARREWSFADSTDQWWHVQLAKLVASLEAFADPKSGLFSSGISIEHGWGIEKRAAFARTIMEQSVNGREAAKRWAEAIASIRDQHKCPKYSGLVIAPQLGLLPVGQDKESGLWEFAHLQSGEPVVRGEDGKLVLKEETGIVLVLIPGGAFKMGAQSTDTTKPNYDPQARWDESPVHEVTLKPYFLSKYEMTQGQWLHFVGSNPKQNSWIATDQPVNLLYPVAGVSWNNCTQVLERLGLVLPAEAEWERGARAERDTPWWTGSEVASLSGAANLSDSYSQAHEGAGTEFDEELNDGYTSDAAVGTFRVNAFGLHDVIGNVSEWCRDGMDDYELREQPPDEVLQMIGLRHAIRGGSFNDPAVRARSARRSAVIPEVNFPDLGLRPVRKMMP